MTNLQTLTLDSLIPENLPNLSALSLVQETDLKLTIYYLHQHQAPTEGSNLEQVQGYLEAFHHLGNLSAWSAAAQLMQRPIAPLACSSPHLFIPPSPHSSPKPESTPQSVGTTKPFYEQLGWWGYYHQQRELCQQVLGKVDLATDCLCLAGLAHAHRRLGQSHLALDYCQQQLDLARHLGDQQTELMALEELGSIYTQLGKPKPAIDCHQQQLTLARKLDNLTQECLSLADLGYIYSIQLLSGRGIDYLHQAETLIQHLNDPELEAYILSWLGQAYLFPGQYQRAIHYLKRCLAIEGVRFQIRIYALLNLATAHYMGLGQPSEGEHYIQQALALCREMGDRCAEFKILNDLGVLYTYGLRKPALAVPLLHRALHYLKTMQHRGIAVILANLCNSYVYLGDYVQAQAYADAAIAALEDEHLPENQAIVLGVLANAAWYQGRRWRAVRLVAQSLWILPPWRSVNGHLILHNILRELGDLWQRWWHGKGEKGKG